MLVVGGAALARGLGDATIARGAFSSAIARGLDDALAALARGAL